MKQVQKWQKVFVVIWAGQAFSTLSSSIVQFAIIWYLTEKTGSGLVLSLAALAGFLPQGLLGPFAGVFVDRWDRKKVMMASDGCIALVSLLIVFVSMGGDPPIWLMLMVLMLRSIGSAFHSPSLSAVTPQLVPAESLTKCAGYSQAIQSVSLVISPALAAMFYANWSLSSIIFLDIIGAAIALAALSFCKIPKLVRTVALERPHVLREAMDGMRELRRHKGLFGLVLITALYFIGMSPVAALAPLMAMGYFGMDAQGASLVEIAFSMGMLAGALILGAWGGMKNKMHTITISVFVMALPLMACAFLPVNQTGFILYVLLSGVMGISMPFYNGTAISLLQSHVDPAYMGRVMSLTVSIMALSSPIGLGLSGLTTDLIGVNNWYGICGLITLLAAVLCIAVPNVRRCALEEPRARIGVEE